jgi:tagaturonate reductase
MFHAAVKQLNGAHTALVPVAYLYGINTVREAVEDPVVGNFLREAI